MHYYHRDYFNSGGKYIKLFKDKLKSQAYYEYYLSENNAYWPKDFDNFDEKVRNFLDYNSDTGKLTFKVNIIGSSRIGDVAGTSGDRCLSFVLAGRRLKVHRVAWFLYYGYWPKGVIDHKNRDYTDNRIENLRDTTQAGNTYNAGLRSDSSTGITGVSYNKKRDEYEVYISRERKLIKLGYFKDFFEACCARKSAEIKHHYTKYENHGRTE